MLTMRAFSAPNLSSRGSATAFMIRAIPAQARADSSSSDRGSSSPPARASTTSSRETNTVLARVTSRVNRYLPVTTPRRQAGVAMAKRFQRLTSSEVTVVIGVIRDMSTTMPHSTEAVNTPDKHRPP